MEHLSGLDANFLHLETTDVPMHVGVLMLLDVPDVVRPGFAEALRRELLGRVHASPVFTRKLAQVALGLANPVWVDAEEADIAQHLHRHALRAPASREQLDHYVARLHAQPLDRTRPLWEMHVIDGLAEGGVALYAKVHHAALDGVGAAALLRILFGTGQGEAAPPPPARHPGTAALLSAAVGHSLKQAWTMARQLPSGLQALSALRDKWPSFAPRTSLNVAITGERSFASLQFPLDEMAAVGRAFNGTVNDALLGAVSGALRHYLDESIPSGRSLVAAVPVNLRERDGGHVGNRAGMWLVDLATSVDDLSQRMRLIVQHTHEMRSAVARARPLMQAEFPGIGMPWLVGGAAILGERLHLADTLPPLANIVVSNVAGPAILMHVAGAPVRAAYPVSIVAHGMALNVTVQSYAGTLYVGIVAATSAVPDLDRFTSALCQAYAALLQMSGPTAEGVTRPRPARVSRKRPAHGAAQAEKPAPPDRAPGQRRLKDPGQARRPRGRSIGRVVQAVPANAAPARRLRSGHPERGS